MKHFTQKLKLFATLVLFAIGSTAWGQICYTLEPVTGSNQNYESNCDVTINDITWNITGNSTMLPWRIGGKSLTKVDRAVYSKTPMFSAISKIDLQVGAASSITVNSLKLVVASDANFTTVIDEVSASFKANSTITFEPTSSEWAENAYYKFVFNVTVSGNNNKFVEFVKADFYASTTKLDAQFAFPQDAYIIGQGESFETPVLTTADGYDGVVYYAWSGDEGVATVNEESGAITLLGGLGQITVTASADATEIFNAAKASYTLKVIDPNMFVYDFGKIDGFATWGTAYTQHIVSYNEATVTFENACRQIGTIMDIPVTKGNDVSLVLNDETMTLKFVEFECRQWTNKTQIITLHYSTNGGETYTSTGITSDNFAIASAVLPEGTNAVKITFSSADNQVGIASVSFTAQANQKISDVGYSTLYYGTVALKVPADVTATTYAFDGTLTESHVYSAGDVIPAGEGVVLTGEKGAKCVFDVVQVSGERDAQNALRGSDEEEETTGGGKYYALSTNSNGDEDSVGFYFMTANGGAFTNGAHRAYLALPANAEVKSFYTFGETAMAISNMEYEQKEAAVYYNLNGQRVVAPTHGIYIVNGKKVFIK